MRALKNGARSVGARQLEMEVTSSLHMLHTQPADPDGGPVTNGISVYWWTQRMMVATKLGAHSTNNVLTEQVNGAMWPSPKLMPAFNLRMNQALPYVNGVDVTDRTDVQVVQLGNFDSNQSLLQISVLLF